MKEIGLNQIQEAVRALCLEANIHLNSDIRNALMVAKDRETSGLGGSIIDTLIRNADTSEETGLPLCQDTGLLLVFADIGQEVHITGGGFEEGVQNGVREAYREGYFRKSIVQDPFTRVNTQDNTPAVIHTRLVPGDQIKLAVMPKGGGAENMSALRMFTPADGWEGVSRFIIDTVLKAGANPCPPVIVGVGIGGTFEKAALIAKRSLLRSIGQRHPDPVYAEREIQLLKEMNQLGIGPQGCGGVSTALDVFIETHPCHIASLPVAVNIQCHSARHQEITL